MLEERPYVISIAGFDPSAGAGVLADIKTFEQHGVYGFGVSSALTVQTDSDFLSLEWIGADQILNQIKPLLSKFNISACKIGLIENSQVLLKITSYLKSINPTMKIVLDPVWKASAGYEINNWKKDLATLKKSLVHVDLITPNLDEMKILSESSDLILSAILWARECPVLLKGGHNETDPAVDFLFEKEDIFEIRAPMISSYPKHGSGCILSSAIASNLAMGFPLLIACKKAKTYIGKFLNSNPTLLGYHTV